MTKPDSTHGERVTYDVAAAASRIAASDNHSAATGPSALSQALDILDNPTPATFAQAGLRLVASTALGQILGGQPGTAIDMINCLRATAIDEIAHASLRLHEICVDQTPEGRAAAVHNAGETPTEAAHILMANAYVYALRDLPARVIDRCQAHSTDELYAMRRAATLLLATIDACLPQDGSDQR